MYVTNRQQVEMRGKEGQVLELRKAGATFHQIANVVGYADPSGAKRAYDRAMQATIQQPADEIRRLELERLDAMLRAVWPAALSGRLHAVDRVLTIMCRRAKLLGLDMPRRREVTVITRDAVEQAIAQLEAELAGSD